MKIFISWSGRRSGEVAKVLGPWLKKVIQSTDYWLSSEMERGVKWMAEINQSLDTHSFGILCVTPGNKAAPWLCFEAGALSKHLGDNGRVIPYLLDFHSPSDLKDPLGQFNASLADEDGTWELVKTLNAHAEYKQGEPELRETFDLRWPSLRESLRHITGTNSSQPPERRTTDDKVDEILSLIRSSGRGPTQHNARSADLTLLRDLLANTRIYVDPNGRVITQFDPHGVAAKALRARQETLEEFVDRLCEEEPNIIRSRVAWQDVDRVRVSALLTKETKSIPDSFKEAILTQAQDLEFEVTFARIALPVRKPRS